MLCSASPLPGSSGDQVRMPLPQLLVEQTCMGVRMVGEPVFKGGLRLIVDKDKSYALVATHRFTDQKIGRGKGRSNREVKHPSPTKISTRWYLLITWELHGTSSQPGAGSSPCSCHLIFVFVFFWLAFQCCRVVCLNIFLLKQEF